MTSEQVKKLVKALHGTGERVRPLKITVDNMFIIDEQKDIVVWNDADEILTVICPVDDYQRQTTTPIGIKCYAYDEIQKMEAFYDINSLNTMISDINSTNPGIIPTEFGNNIMAYFMSLYGN